MSDITGKQESVGTADAQALAAIAQRLRSLRDDEGITPEEMAAATHISVADYTALETGTRDFSFTTLYHAAAKLGVDMIDLLTGEGPHLSGYSIVRAGQGLAIRRRQSFEYLHLAPTFKNKLAEPFVVTAPYIEGEEHGRVLLASHEGQELNYILSGQLRFAYEDEMGVKEELLNPGDALFYDSGHGHGMQAAGGQPCTFLAVVFKPQK